MWSVQMDDISTSTSYYGKLLLFPLKVLVHEHIPLEVLSEHCLVFIKPWTLGSYAGNEMEREPAYFDRCNSSGGLQNDIVLEKGMPRATDGCHGDAWKRHSKWRSPVMLGRVDCNHCYFVDLLWLFHSTPIHSSWVEIAESRLWQQVTTEIS